MTAELVFDVETTPVAEFDARPGEWKLRPQIPERIHCLVIREVGSGTDAVYHDAAVGSAIERAGYIADGYCRLRQAARDGALLIGHNITRFDIDVLDHHLAMGHPGIVGPGTRLFDTRHVATQQFFATLEKWDYARRKAAARKVPFHARSDAEETCHPARLIGKQSLEAWGHRLGFRKGRPQGGTKEEQFGQLTADLVTYCRRDVELNEALYRYLRTHGGDQGWPVPPLDAMIVESRFSYILRLQERNGVGFDEEHCRKIVAEWMAERAELEVQLREMVPAWYAPESRHLTVPKRSQKRRKGREIPEEIAEGAAYQKLKRVEFNPGSDIHVADRLMTLYGWQPQEFTDRDGWVRGAYRPVPKCSGEVLGDLLDFDVIEPLLRWKLLDKRIEQAAEGAKGWLRRAVDGEHGRRVIYGRQNTTGARTSRCSHHSPNMNVPKIGRPFGKECRECFRPTRPGWAMLGADATGLEMRMLASRLHPYDGGAFGVELLQGDIHTVRQKRTKIKTRDGQKELTYADLYGAGDEKRGLIIIKHWRLAYKAGKCEDPPPPLSHAVPLGKLAKQAMLEATLGMAELLAAVARAHKRGYVRLLDGRIVAVDSKHGTLNDLLQGDGMVVMKWAIVLWHDAVMERGLKHGVDYAFMLQVHDEIDPEVRDAALAAELGELFRQCVKEAGVKLGVKIELDGSVAVGANWAEVH